MSTPTRLPTRHAAPIAPDWSQAVCAQTDPSVFFPEGRGAAIVVATDQAKQVCSWCPIQEDCLTWAVDTGQPSGVWGGLDDKERRVLLRQRGDRATSYARCIDEQEFIERRVAEGASHRTIAEELGVGHTSVGKACRFFQAEREAQAGAGVAA